MPKRKKPPQRQSIKKKPKLFSSLKCPTLPQEIWDRIINFSCGELDTLLGVLPHDLHTPLRNPLMRINQACRQEVIRLVSSNTWILLKSLDRVHTHLARYLSEQVSLLDPFWVPLVVNANQGPHITFDFGIKRSSKVTRQTVKYTETFVTPYSYATMLRLIPEIGVSIVDHLLVKSTSLPLAQVREVDSVLTFLHAHSPIQPQSWPDDINNIHQSFTSGVRPTLQSLSKFLYEIMCQMVEMSKDATVLTRKASLLMLYMSQYFDKMADEVLEAPWAWASFILHDSDWQTNTETRDRTELGPRFHGLEMDAFGVFCNLLVTDMRWTIHHAPYLTSGHHRWTEEPQFSYYGISDNQLARFYMNIGTAIGIYSTINLRTENPASTDYVHFAKRKRAFEAASMLRPNKTKWRDRHLAATEELNRHFPDLARSDSYMSNTLMHYTDIDGGDHTHLNTRFCLWGAQAMRYLHRARQLITGWGRDMEESDVDSGID